MTLGVLTVVFDHAKFICVEASPANFSKLKQRTRELKLGLKITLINKAVAYGAKIVNFDQTTTAGSRIQNGSTIFGEKFTVEAASLSEILEREEVDGWYTLIPDIEGSESNIFFSDVGALAKCTKIISELEDLPTVTVADRIKQLKLIGFGLVERYGNIVYFQRDREC